MRGLSAHPLQLYEDPPAGSGGERVAEVPTVLSPAEKERAEQLACQETWRTYPPRHPTATFEPYTLEWFKQIELRRYSRHGYWIPKHLEVQRHSGEQVLGLGDGLGTDWVQYAAHGANFHYCTPSGNALALVQKQFALRHLTGQYYKAPLTAIPLPNEALDVVCVSTLSAGLASPIESIVGEVARILKPGGKVIVALPAKYDARWWQDFWFPWNRWFGGRKTERVGHWSSKSLQRVFHQFSVDKVHKRHLRRSDLPHVWRWMLLPCLERIMGRFLILKAFKPLISVPPVPAAA